MSPQRLKLLGAIVLLSLCFGGRLVAQPIEFTRVQRLTNHEVALTLTAPVGRAYRVESAASLTAWGGLFTFPTNATTSLQYTDAAAPFLAMRYYRAVELTGTNLISGDHLATGQGDAIIQPRNHATFVLQWNGKMIYLDPVPTATYTGLPKADLILVTHTHSDHFNTATIDAVRGPVCAIIAPQAVYDGLSAAQKTIAIVLANNASVDLLGVAIHAVPAYGASHALGVGNGYVLGIGGKRIYVSGDTGDQPEIRALTDIDIAFVSMNQPYTMTVGAATNCVRALRPRVVYPYHYRDQSGATTNAATFKQWLGTDLGIEVRLRNWY